VSPPLLPALLWTLVAVYAIARITQAFPGRIPLVTISACHILPALAFALVHGAAVYRPRGILAFVLCCFVIGNLMENLSIGTGFPFGHYHFTDVMGPKLLQVPILLGLAYIGVGYLSWTLAGLILRRHTMITRPLLAAGVMVAWDLSMEPIWSNLVGAWTWHNGGAYFGVPVSNFLGWYLTNYLIYQSFAVWLSKARVKPRVLPDRLRPAALLFYAVCAAGNLLVLAAPAPAVITDAAGTAWRVSSIMWASMLVSILVMGAMASIAFVRSTSLRDQEVSRKLGGRP
jgi:putative membrane protein